MRLRRGVRDTEVGAGVRLGRGVRLDAAAGGRIVLEDGCEVGDGCRLLARGAEVRIGAGAVLGERCRVIAQVGIAVGAGARLGDGAMAVDFDHVIADVETPIRLQPIDAAPVTIGARARIGRGASILRGVTVGEGAVIGAHAVVTRDVPAGARAGGVPARVGGGSVAPVTAAPEGVEQPLEGEHPEEA